MLTYDKAKEVLLSARYKKDGKPLGNNLILVKNKNNFLIMRDYQTLITITKKGEYKLGLIDASNYQAVNKLIPGKLKMISKELFYGSMPYYQGMILTKDGDVNIEDAWSPDKEYDLKCVDCEERYSTKRCSSCIYDHIDNITADAEECETEGDPDDYDDDYNYHYDDNY